MIVGTHKSSDPDQLVHFLAMVSHEIRTPLGGLMGLLSALAVEKDDARRAEILRLAQASGEHLRLLLDDLVDLVRLQRDDFSVAPQNFDAAEAFREAIEFWAGVAEAEKLSLSFTCPEAPITLMADRVRLRQIADNLISNALKYTDGGLVRAYLVVEEHYVRFDVVSTGPLLNAADVEPLFQEFVRRPDSAQIRPGAGLGLAISRQLAQMMGGDLGFREMEGANCFWVRVPLMVGPPKGYEAEDAAVPHITTSPLKVLVVEDVATNRIVLTHFLRQMGHESTEVGTGSQALELLREEAFDLVLLDRFLPDMDGLDTARRIRDIDGPAAKLPIIGVSGYQRASDIAEMRDAGMTAFAPKPVTPRNLSTAIAQALSSQLGEPRQ